MLAAMRPSVLGEWMALYGIDPWGEQRADLRAGIVASTIANVNRDARRKPEPFEATDFMPYRERKTVPLAAKAKSVLKSLSPKSKKKQG